MTALTPSRDWVMASHRRYTSANGDALAGAVTYALLLALAPVVVLLATVASWAGPAEGWFAARVAAAAGATLPAQVVDVVGAAAQGHRTAGWVAAAMVAWSAVRAVRAARTAVRAMCGQPAGSGNPIADALRDVWMAALLYAGVAVGVLVLAGAPSGPAARVLLGWLVAVAVIGLGLRLLPWPGAGRPSLSATLLAALTAATAVVLLASVGRPYLDATMPGRESIYGTAATLVATAVWVAVSVRVVLRTLSLAAVRTEVPTS